MPALIKIYLFVTSIFGGLLRFIILFRLWIGKEDPLRFKEKFGEYKKIKPDKKLIWFHGASVGETLSILVLIKAISERDSNLRFLITSGTKTSAQILSNRMPKEVIHQFVPLDIPKSVNAFLNYWKPDFAIWVESEIWPRLLTETSKRKIPTWLVNGSMSVQSYKSWRKFPLSAQYLYNRFERMYLRDERTAGFLNKLGLINNDAVVLGSLKADQEKLNFNKTEYEQTIKSFKGKKIWLASSTHRGEEEVILQSHKTMLEVNPNMVLILVPRPPERGKELIKLASFMDLRASLRSLTQDINSTDQVYIGDTLGELGLWYELASICFIGGSLSKDGGHNPYEAILSDSFILHGPETFNFSEIYSMLDEKKCAIRVTNSREISEKILEMLDSENLEKQHNNARNLISSDKKKINLLADQIHNRLKGPNSFN